MLVSDTPFSPPPQLRIAGWLILIEFVVVIALVVASSRLGFSFLAARAAAVVINCIACVYLGIAAKSLGKSWQLYGLLPAIGTLIFFSFYSYTKLRSDAWYSWADRHAKFVPDERL